MASSSVLSSESLFNIQITTSGFLKIPDFINEQQIAFPEFILQINKCNFASCFPACSSVRLGDNEVIFWGHLKNDLGQTPMPFPVGPYLG